MVVNRNLYTAARCGSADLPRGWASPQDFTFDAGAFAASVTLIVPPGVNVVFDVFAAMASATSQADEPSHTDARAPWIRVTGSVFMGEVKVVVRDRDT